MTCFRHLFPQPPSDHRLCSEQHTDHLWKSLLGFASKKPHSSLWLLTRAKSPAPQKSKVYQIPEGLR